MATLGTLAAGVAHELNNPAAATPRASEQLRDAFARLQQAQLQLDAAFHSDTACTLMPQLDQRALKHSLSQSEIDTVTRSDRESEIEFCLEDHDVPDAIAHASPLVAMDYTVNELDAITETLDEQSLIAVMTWIACAYPVYALLNEIHQGAARISEIVGALKNYSFLGQAPVQNVNIHDGIDNTLVILRSKLKAGVTVHREYGSDMPLLTMLGSELNQVWTNLLDNAIDAMNGHGEIYIRTRREAQWVVVEIEDNGPGIPADAQPRIFDPFFTTKAPGKGTGAGSAPALSQRLSHSESRFRERSAGSRAAVEAAGGTPIALFIADQRMPEMVGTEVLTELRKLFPEAKKVLLTAYADTEAAISSINDVGLDHYLLKPWDPPEEKLYPVLDDLLLDWSANVRLPYDGIRVAGARWSPQSFAVKEFLSRNHVPYQWIDIDADAPTRELAQQICGATLRLPVVFFPDGTHLTDPSHHDLAKNNRHANEGRATILRHGNHRRRTGGACISGLRRLRRTANVAHRTSGTGRTGRHNVTHRKLSRFSVGSEWSGSCATGNNTSKAVRCGNFERAGSGCGSARRSVSHRAAC